LASEFYVYEHWRPDLDICFYVGKGCRARAWLMHRKENAWHRAVVAKLKRLGLCVEVRMVRGELSEDEAFALEIERIAFWRSLGVSIVNMTDGGDGCSGRKLSPSGIERLRCRVFTEDHRKRISEAKTGKPKSSEHRSKLSASLAGRTHSPETIEKRIAPLRGRLRSEEIKQKIRATKARRAVQKVSESVE